MNRPGSICANTEPSNEKSDMKEIPLTKGYIAIVDDEDYEAIACYNWHVLDSHPRIRYAARWSPGSYPFRYAIRMHHVVIGVSGQFLLDKCLVVDHIDRDGLNNRRDNLRIATRRINALNSERSDNALGIYYDTYRGMYKTVELQPIKKFVGWFNTFEEAYDKRFSHEGD